MYLTPGKTHPLLLMVLSLLLASSVMAQEVQAPEKFKDWAKTCEKVDGIEEDVCYIFQNMVETKSKQVAMNLNIHYTEKGESPAMLVTLPLGVALEPGIRIQVDEGTPIAIPFNACFSYGCRAGMKLDDKILGAMKKGVKLNISFATLQGKGARFTSSLSGFTAALSALK